MESKRKWSQVPGALVLTLLLALSGCTAASNSSEANPQSTVPPLGIPVKPVNPVRETPLRRSPRKSGSSAWLSPRIPPMTGGC